MVFKDIKRIIENTDFNEQLIDTEEDGRINSALSETIIRNHVADLFQGIGSIIIPEVRYWYDIKLIIDQIEYPINIKITEGNSADNISSKKGLYYTLTGIEPEKEKGLDKWEAFNSKITANFKTATTTDYYFIVYFKSKNLFLFTSLKRLNTIVPNGNNLPFQCKWNDNIIATARNEKEQMIYLMKTFIASFKKRTPGLDILCQWEEENE